MREGTAPLIRREDYAPPAYWIRSVELSFDLDPAKTIVSSRLSIERNADIPGAQPLKLHGEDLNLLRVHADGSSVSFRQDDGCLVIDNPPATPTFTLEIRNTVCPRRTRSCRACTRRAAASSRNARPRAFAASRTSSTGPT